MHPQAKFLLFFVLPMPAWAVLSLMASYDTYQLLSKQRSIFDSAGHLGGLATGMLYYAVRVRPFLRRF
jgi:membrane associated rhomboid family serine protease